MSDNRVLDVLREWFPKHKFGDLHDLKWNELTLLRHPDLVAIIAKEARENLEQIEIALNKAYVAMRKLPPDVLRAMEDAHRLNAQMRLESAPRTATRDRLRSGDIEKEVFVSAQDMLVRLILGLSGDWPELSKAPKSRRKPSTSAYKVARAKIDSMTTANAKEAENDTWAKVALVENARLIWQLYGEKQAPTRRLHPRSPFANFLSDLITALEKDWQPVASHYAWSERQKCLDKP